MLQVNMNVTDENYLRLDAFYDLDDPVRFI